MARCRHNLEICSRCVVPTDAAKRMADTINLKIISHTWDELVNGYMAFKLADGTSDNVLYDSHAVAARHTDETQCGYFCFRSGMGGPDVKRQPDLIISTWGYDVMSGRPNPRDKP